MRHVHVSISPTVRLSLSKAGHGIFYSDLLVHAKHSNATEIYASVNSEEEKKESLHPVSSKDRTTLTAFLHYIASRLEN